MNICATYKRSGDQRESIIPQNDRHNKKQRELFAASAAVVLNWVVCAINLFSHLQFTTISFVERQIGVASKKCIWKLWAVTRVFNDVDLWNLHFVCC